MPSINDLIPFVTEPREDLGVEYKTWLDLTTNENKALLAKAAIALVNHGGGFIVIGFSDEDELVSRPRPEDMPEVHQDAVNDAIRRYASPEFHCEVYLVPHPNGITHPVISVPGNFAVPVMSKRDCQGVITQHTCYIRKSGPRSEAPQSGEEWRTLLDRCVRAGRDELLEAIRGIMSGNAAAAEVPPDALQRLRDQVEQARARWTELVAPLPPDSPSKFPHGYYEMAFSLVGAQRAPGLAELQDRLSTARQVRLTGWTPFLELHRDGLRPYPHDNFVEAWVGRPVEERAFGADPSHADFWRASPDGLLYTIRGYTEDGLGDRPAGRFIDITLPVWRVAEALLFARRLADTFAGVEAIACYSRFTGLRGRRLVSITGNRMLHEDRLAETDQIVLQAQANLGAVDNNLVEVVHEILSPLYERFNFFGLPVRLVDEELARMRAGRF